MVVRKYIFLFKIPVYKDWAFWVWLALTLLGSDGGKNLIASGIAMYLVNLVWLLPRKILFKPTQQKISNNSVFNKIETFGSTLSSEIKKEFSWPGSAPIEIDEKDAVILRKGGYQDVVGESNNRKSFVKISGNMKTGEIETLIELRREPMNKFDKNAIQVLYQNNHLGYIPREETEYLQKILTEIESLGKRTFASGRIWWDLNQGEYDGPFGSVTLDIAEPRFAICINEKPKGDVIDLTGSKSYQLSNELNYLSTIEKLLDKGLFEKGVAGYAVLKPAQTNSESEKQVINVLVDDEIIGQLSAATGSKFLPILNRIPDGTGSFIAEFEIAGNALAAEAKIYLTLPEDFDKSTVNAIRSLESKGEIQSEFES